MKIKKSLFYTEVKVTPRELAELYYDTPIDMKLGLFVWLKQNFNLDLTIKASKK